ncbi:TonB-dependent receptor plug domain-containing protein [Hyphococcus luteus]|uniref:TonB-dependent receptor n=1 Tax=Hyphococcus luteus TaxID=2058213 RepID=A0A2S7KAJ5_9PROT|nr:TonB-dependent receptor [Marinicaulis flavus]PQA89540.1 TonB-dependent receptor [Marinicaulis flavus]
MNSRLSVTNGRQMLLGATALSLVMTAQAAAQDETASPSATESATTDMVIVTGSRIARRDDSSDSPLYTVSTENLLYTSETSIDQQLKKLPQFGASADQITSATDVQPSPTSSPGIATVNLRGLGSNRTLVLIDGRRTQPANASLVVDLNTIPVSAIDSVEIITGGAGATYGADAVAGVVNFKLKDDFQGVTLDGQYGQSFHDDARQYQLSALIGANLDDGRGNVMASFSYTDRDAVGLMDRDFFLKAYTDPNTPGRGAWPNFGGYSGGSSQAAIDSVFTPKGYAAGDVADNAVLYFNTAPTTDAATLFSVAPGAVSGDPAPGFEGELFPNNKLLSDGSLSPNSVPGFLSLPLQRYSAFTKGHYELHDNVTFYVQGRFDQTETSTEVLGYAPAFNQWSVSIPYDSDHPVPDELATILDNRDNPTANWQLYKQLDYLGPRQITTTSTTYEFLGGFRGDIGYKDWTYDVFGSHGRTRQNAEYRGFTDHARYQDLIAQPDYGAGAVFDNGRLGRLASCTSGINPFVNTPISQDCLDILSAPINTITDIEQDQVELNVQGSLAEVPAGDLRFAVGAAYRSNSFKFQPDPAISTTNTTSFTVGLFDTTDTEGSTNVKEFYAEILAPLLSDMPMVQSFTVNAGFRYSDYNTTGGVTTWKATADWEVTDSFKIRGGYQVANRAPNIAELFQPPVFATVPWPDHDPCSILTRADYGNVASNPDRAQVQALCTALAQGFTIDDTYVGNVPVYFPLGRDRQTGNPDLDSEKAKTWTVGAVLNSPFESGVLESLRLSVDYYNITVNGAIAPASTQLVYQECFNDLGNNPSYDPNNEFCQRILRQPNGLWIATIANYENLGMISTAGIDAQFDWSIEAPGFGGEAGTFFTNVVFNWLQKYEVQNNPGGPIFDYAGSVGSDISTPPYGAQFDWKLNTTFGYHFGPASISLNWRHLPGAKHIALVTNDTASQEPLGSYDIFDLSTRWSVNDVMELRAGIDNLFDKDPLRYGVIEGVTAAAGETDPSGAYDVLGRRFYIGAKARF